MSQGKMSPVLRAPHNDPKPNTYVISEIMHNYCYQYSMKPNNKNITELLAYTLKLELSLDRGLKQFCSELEVPVNRDYTL